MTKLFRSSPVLMLLFCTGSLLGHLYLLNKTQVDWLGTPISQLSGPGSAWQHGVTLALFAAAQALLAVMINQPGASLLTRCIQFMAVINALLIISLAYFFTLNDTSIHTAMLVVIASITGTIMACLLARQKNRQKKTTTLLNGVFLAAWLVLVPVFLVIDAEAIGAYQRCVGAVFMAWLCAIALLPLHYNAHPDS